MHFFCFLEELAVFSIFSSFFSCFFLQVAASKERSISASHETPMSGTLDGTLASTKPSACAAPLARFGLGCLREQVTVDPFLTVISTTFASSTSRPALRCLSAWARSPPLPAWRGRPWRRPGPRYPPQPGFGLGP